MSAARERAARRRAGAAVMASAVLAGLLAAVAPATAQPAQGALPPLWKAVKNAALENYGDPDPNAGNPGSFADVDFATPEVGYALAESMGFGGGARGAVMVKTEDGGETWSLTGAQPPQVKVRAVQFVTEDVGHVALSAANSSGGPGLLRTEDGGASFQMTFAIPPGIGTSAVQDVAFVTASLGWILAPGGSLLMTTDGGATWQGRAHPTGGSFWSGSRLQAVGGQTVDDVVLYVTNGSAVYRSGDAGATWANLDLQGDVTIPNVRSLHCVDVSTCFVAGYASGGPQGSAQARVARTDDAGATWEDVSPRVETQAGSQELPMGLEDVAFAGDGRTGHAVGWLLHPGTGQTPQNQMQAQYSPLALSTTDGGESWEAEPVDLTAFADRRAGGGGANTRRVQLRAVDLAGGASVAVGDFLAITKRTTDPSAWPPDPQTACLPPALVPSEARSDVQDNTELPDEAPAQVLCDPVARGPRAAGPVPPFVPPPPTACPVGHPEADNDPGDPGAPFPCVGEVHLRTEAGDRALGGPNSVTMHDRALRRFVTVVPQDVATRVAMFDPVDLVQRGVEGFGAGFHGDSAWAPVTGVVAFGDADLDVPRQLRTGDGGRLTALMPVDPAARRHNLVMVGCGPGSGQTSCLSPALVTMSLTGEFLPRVGHQFQPVTVGQQTRAVLQVTHVAYDEANRLLYVITRFGPVHSVVPFATLFASNNEEPRNVVWAFDADPDGGGAGELRPMWSQDIAPGCKHTDHNSMRFMGVSPDGRALAFGCAGSTPLIFGTHISPSGIMRWGLPDDVAPRAMTQADAPRIEQRFLPVAAALTNNQAQEGTRVWGDARVGLVFWASPRHVVRLYDFAADRWIGSFQVLDDHDRAVFTTGMAADPETGRLYAFAEKCPGVCRGGQDRDDIVPKVRLAETLNLPASARRPVPLASDPLVNETGTGESVSRQVFDPDSRRLVMWDGTVFRVFEDRVAPSEFLGVEDPDTATNDIDEDEAAFVRRDASARGYGSRLWWSGLYSGINDGGLDTGQVSWDQVFTPEDAPTGQCNQGISLIPLCPGYYTTRAPGVPAPSARELLFGRVSTAELSNLESRAVVASQTVDDDSQGDLRRRRLLSELRRFAELPLSGWDEDFDEGRGQLFGDPGWREFERCTEELGDRAYREVDGERRVSPPVDEDGNQAPDCFEQFDEQDPRESRSSVMEETGFVAELRCDNAASGAPDVREGRGTEVACDRGTWRTEAASELAGFTRGAPGTDGPQGGWLRVGSSGSQARLVREERGLVVRSTSVATDVELGFAGQGSLRIGEVRATAESWAKGRPGTAGSWLDVAFEDVVITHPDGSTRFSCGRARPAEPLVPDADYHRDEDFDAHHGACDAQEVVEAINRGFIGKVQATTPARDTDDKVAGSPKGARAIVRRDPAAYWSDVVINGFSRWEIPALQLTVYNDSATGGPNRVLLDLAAVFTESNYSIGERGVDFTAPAPTGPVTEAAQPATITVRLTDSADAPLGGGVFAVADEAGAPAGSCTTTSAGACRVAGLPAGDYVVSQAAAPPGFLPETATSSLFAAAGAEATATFVNLWSSGGVAILLTDPAEQPLPGGRFQLVADLDGDGAAGGGDAVVDACVTDGAGTCLFPEVELASWVVRQTGAPDGFEAADPVAFALSSPGQVARLHVMNGTPGTETSRGDVEVVDDPTRGASREPGGLPTRLLALPSEIARFALRNPTQAALFALVWLLMGAPLYLAVRRRELQHCKGWA